MGWKLPVSVSSCLIMVVAACASDPIAPRGDAATDHLVTRADASDCTSIGCESGLFSSTTLAGEPSAFVGAEFRTCFGTECGAGVLSSAPTSGLVELPLDGGVCSIWVGAVQQGMTTVEVRCPVSLAQCKDNMPVSLSVQRFDDGGADAGIDRTWVHVIYFKDLYPNGMKCSPHCRRYDAPW